MLLTLLLDPQGAAVYRVGATVIGLWLLWLLYCAVRLLLIGLVVGLGMWSVQRVIREAKRDSPREGVIWQGLAGLCLALSVLIVGWEWVVGML